MEQDRQAFIKQLETGWDDDGLHQVYADWLEENGFPDEAQQQRNWRESRQWLENWVRSVNYTPYAYDDDGNEVLDADGRLVRVDRDNLGDPHTLADAVEAGYCAVGIHKDQWMGEGYCWATDAGADYFRGGRHNTEPWFKHWSIVTGVDAAKRKPGILSHPPFRCAC